MTASNPIAPSRRASWIAPRTWASRKSSRSRKTCTYSRVPGFAQPGLQEPPQPEKLVWQRPPGQRRRLIERARLALQQGQVVQRIEDQLLTPVAATMTGDLLTPADDHDDVHVALHHHVAVAVGGCEGADQTGWMKSRVHPTYKTKYHVQNWAAYDRALVCRGDITIWLSPAAIAAWEPDGAGPRGAPRQYSDLAIESALTLRLLFHLLSVSNSSSGRRWKLDHAPAVGDPTHMVEFGTGRRAFAREA